MSLSKLKLQRELYRIFTRSDFISTRDHARRLWWEAYDDYARDAQDVSGDQVLKANSYRFLKTLKLRVLNNINAAAADFDAAFRAYWGGATFNVGQLIVSPPGTCPSIGGNGVWSSEASAVVISVQRQSLAGRLVPIFRSQSQVADAERAAREFSTAFHDATTSAVRVLITGLDTGTPTPQLISNTCTIF